MSTLKSPPIVHATTVHPWWDNRVSNKMVTGLAEAGFPVYFILNSYPPNQKPSFKCLNIKTLERKSGIKERVVKNFIAYKKASSIPQKGIFHFHDPEMIFVAAAMRLRGWKVIYDVHEDVYLDIAQKPYFGKIAQLILPYLFRAIEQTIIKLFGFQLVLAEKSYKKRYPKGIEILNYPKQTLSKNHNNRQNYQEISLLYTGVLLMDRGALKFKEILQTDPNITITIIGKCSENLKQKVLKDCAPYHEQLTMKTTPEGISFEEITDAYQQGNWTAGLAVFPDTEFYRDKELTKFFEYIQYSIPILASHFPTWLSLIEKQKIGLCIDPDDISTTLSAVLHHFRDEEKWTLLRDNCQKVATKYSWESQQEKLINLYKNIC